MAGTAFDYATSGDRAVVEHYDGSTWTVRNPPVGANWTSQLTAISEVTPGDIWAVGELNYQQAQVLHYTGGLWSIVKTYDTYNVAGGITAFSDRNVWLTGSRRTAHTHPYAFADHYTGSTWQATTLPSNFSGGYRSMLTQLAGPSNDMWAVGAAYTATGQTILAAHWDGTRWTAGNTPAPGPAYSAVEVGVTYLGPGNVWAVGNSGQGDGVAPLAEHYDGRTWTVSPAPGVLPRSSGLSGVAGDGAGGLWAVGTSSPTVAAPNGIESSLIEHYDGHQWQVAANPLPTTTASGLNASTTTGTTSWAVGSSANHPEGVVLRAG